MLLSDATLSMKLPSGLKS